MAYIARNFGYFPEGINYVEGTRAIVKQALQNNGIDDSKIYEDDFISWKPPKQYDLVFSGGFIEHFTDEILA